MSRPISRMNLFINLRNYIAPYLRRLYEFCFKVFWFAYSDIKSKYARNYLGPFWIVISMSLSSLGIALLWTQIFDSDPKTTIPLITIGFVLWIVSTSVIQESLNTYTSKASTLKSIRLNILFFPAVLTAKHFLSFLHYLIIFILIKLYVGDFRIQSIMLFLFGIIYFFSSLFLLSIIFGYYASRFRDLESFVNSILPMMFFLSPVLLRDKMLGDYSYFLWLNPFSYLIWFVRDPFLNVPFDEKIYIFAISLLLVYIAIFWFLIKNKLSQIVSLL